MDAQCLFLVSDIQIKFYAPCVMLKHTIGFYQNQVITTSWLEIKFPNKAKTF